MSSNFVGLDKLSFPQIQRKANEVLNLYHPNLTLPIPIEEIVEIQMRIKLISKLELKRGFGIDAFITNDFRSIVVDDFVFNQHEVRSRFSLAHEIAHYWLHKNYYEYLCLNIDSVEDFIEGQNRISDQDYKEMERQANFFAGCVLIPEKKLREEVYKICAFAGKREAHRILEPLLSTFNVSRKPLEIQLKETKLLDFVKSKINQDNF